MYMEDTNKNIDGIKLIEESMFTRYYPEVLKKIENSFQASGRQKVDFFLKELDIFKSGFVFSYYNVFWVKVTIHTDHFIHFLLFLSI